MSKADVIIEQEARTAREIAEMSRLAAIQRAEKLLSDLKAGGPRATYARVCIGDLAENLATLQAYQLMSERINKDQKA